MIIWDLVLIMKLLVVGAQPWLIVLMVQGIYILNHGSLYCFESCCAVKLYFLFITNV